MLLHEQSTSFSCLAGQLQLLLSFNKGNGLLTQEAVSSMTARLAIIAEHGTDSYLVCDRVSDFCQPGPSTRYTKQSNSTCASWPAWPYHLHSYCMRYVAPKPREMAIYTTSKAKPQSQLCLWYSELL